MKLPIHEIARTVYEATRAFDAARDVVACPWEETTARVREDLYNEVHTIMQTGKPAPEPVVKGAKVGKERPEYVRTREAIVVAIVGALK